MNENIDESTGFHKRNAPQTGKTIPEFDFEKLSGKEVIVRIRLGSEVYELRKTKTGKLVLNK